MAEQWKLVPSEPTDQMTFVGQSHRYDSAWSIGAIYREMLAAAPTQGADARPVAITDRTRDELFAEYFEDREGSAQVAEHAYRQGWKDRATYTVVPNTRPVPWDNLPCYLIDKCEGQVISEEFLQRALSEMLADPQYSGAKPFELSQEFISNAKDGPDVIGFCADAPAPKSIKCPECEGTGYDGSGYARVCPACKGNAMIATRATAPSNAWTVDRIMDVVFGALEVQQEEVSAMATKAIEAALIAASDPREKT